MHLLEIAFQAFFDNTKASVSDGVQKNVAFCISKASSPDERNQASKLEKQHLNSLKSWMASERPLAYGHNDSQPIYHLLLQAISHSTQEIVIGLPNFTAHAMTPSYFADLLINISSLNNPSRPSAPILTNGSFLPVLKLVHKYLITLSDCTQSNAQCLFIHPFLIRTIDHL